jgi:tRNA pseudouridine55 synthase
MLKNLYLINKKLGETPLEALEVFRNKKKINKDIPMTYAGRLDPMASGLLILLAGEECKNKERYLNLDKEYEFQVLFGFSTDTYDILGKVLDSNILKNVRMSDIGILEKEIKKNLKYFKGKIVQKYPIYSSKTVAGKPLFSYARSGEEVDIPNREFNIKSLKYIKIKKISKDKLLQDIKIRISKVKGDFRQKEILKTWEKVLNSKDIPLYFFIASFSIKCSSGTYVRSISNALGSRIGIPALAYNINRLKIGKYKL